MCSGVGLVRGLAPVLLLLAACGPTAIQLDALLADGKRDELTAHHAYEGRRLRVSGVVEKRGLASSTHEVIDYLDWKPEIHAQERFFGVVVLVPADAEAGRLLCYFTPQHRGQVTKIAPHTSITVTGFFTRYLHERGRLAAQLDDCQVDGV